MNPKQLQQAIDTPEMHDLVKAYLIARAYAETVREAVSKVYNQILQDIPVYSSDEFGEAVERIYDHEKLYRSRGDLDHIYDEMDKRLRAAGLKPESMERDFCPALVAEDELRKIKHQLVNTSGKPLNVTVDKLLCQPDGLKMYDKWIDLVVGAIVNSPKFVKPTI